MHANRIWVGRLERTRKVKEGKDNEGGKRDERLKGGQIWFQGGDQEQGSQVAKQFTSRQAIKAKARLPQVHEDLILSKSGHQVQASSSGDEKVSKDKLKRPKLQLISRIE